jgi:hypothetical protein
VLHPIHWPITNSIGPRTTTLGQNTLNEDLPFFFACFCHYCMGMAPLGDLSVREFQVQDSSDGRIIS